jgi:hypothetical protein
MGVPGDHPAGKLESLQTTQKDRVLKSINMGKRTSFEWI